MKPRNLLLAISLSALLAACGGADGGSIASAPPPVPAPTPTPTPTPTPVATTTTVHEPYPSPVTRVGTYDAIAAIQTVRNGDIVASRPSTGGDVRMVIAPVPTGNDQLSYTLQFSAPDIPASQSIHLFPDACLNGVCTPFGWKHEVTEYAADGRVLTISSQSHPIDDSGSENQMPSGDLAAITYYSIGLSHVTYGIWESDLSHFSDIPLQDGTRVYFVHGDRTPAGEIPTTGTATYNAVLPSLASKTPSGGIVQGLNFSLTADFLNRSIGALIFQDYATYPLDEMSTGAVPGINVSGNAPFSTVGSFSIPLSGTLTLGVPGPLTTAAVGTLDGAFFGPGAAQIGGVFSVGSTLASPIITDVFLGVKN